MALAAKWPVVDMFVGLSGVRMAPVVKNPQFFKDPVRMFSMSKKDNGRTGQILN